MREIQIKFADRLKMLRGDKKQATFAKELGVLQQTYSRWEIGDRQPKLQDFAALALHFGVSTDWLLGLTDKSEPVDSNSPARISSRIESLKNLSGDATKVLGQLQSAIDALGKQI